MIEPCVRTAASFLRLLESSFSPGAPGSVEKTAMRGVCCLMGAQTTCGGTRKGVCNRSIWNLPFTKERATPRWSFRSQPRKSCSQYGTESKRLLMRNPTRKKSELRVAQLPRGLKPVAPPKSRKLRRLMEGEDITTSGGCHTVHRPSVSAQALTEPIPHEPRVENSPT